MERDKIRPVRNVVLPQICWGKMDEHTVCVRLDNAQPGTAYRVVFNGTYTAEPDENGLFWFRDAVPGSRYEIDCEAEVSPGVWESCCDTVKLNFVPPPPAEDGQIIHIGGGESGKMVMAVQTETVKCGRVVRRG